MLVLTDRKATTANITRALRSFLKRPSAEDLVLVYLACHGAPDPDRPQVVYLLTHDSNSPPKHARMKLRRLFPSSSP
jgi:uncharacterized caspase-like protein